MSRDLTAIILRAASSSLVDPSGAPLGGEAPADASWPTWVESVVRSRGRPAILRVAPLDKLGLVQVEVCDVGDGLPTEDPELVAALSQRGAATFVHVNHEAKQAIVHGCDKGVAGEGFMGEPGAEFATKLHERLGCDLDALHAADDQSRFGIGIIASRTIVILPGRNLALPVGMPSGFGSFQFHDRGIGVEAEAERCAFLAFDRPLTQALLSTSGAELAKVVSSVASGGGASVGGDETEALAGALSALGDQTIAAAPPEAWPTLLRAAELLILASGRVFAAGDRADFWDERVLPLLSLQETEPVIDDEEGKALASAESMLHALVEVVPSSAPPGGPGSVLECIADAELSPLLPPLAKGGAYAGSILALDPTRIGTRLRELDGARLTAAIHKVEAAWYKQSTGQAPEGEAFDRFRKEHAERGQTDVDRTLRQLSELRVVLEVAAVNDLAVAIAFYG